MSGRGRIAAILLAGTAAAAACGGGEPGFPSADWSGWYQTTMADSWTDCAGTELPPPMTGFTMTLEQRPDNSAHVRMGTFMGFDGTFDGDSLHAGTTFDVPVSLPDSIAARATPADSLDAIAYAFDAAFADGAFRGIYEVRTPDLNALVHGDGPGRCTYRYELKGTEVEDLPTTAPAEAPGPVIAPDTAAGR